MLAIPTARVSPRHEERPRARDATDEDGEDKLIAVARHIARTIGRTNTMTDDILQIFSSFDHRFSPEKLALHQDSRYGLSYSLDSIDRRISCYLQFTRPIWSESCASESFLRAVDDLIGELRRFDDADGDDRDLLDRANDLLHRSMLRLEDEFKKLILQETSSGSPESSDEEEEEEEAIEFASPVANEDRIPVAIPATVEPLSQGTAADLYEIARRMVRGGYGTVCASAYAEARASSVERSLARSGARERPVGGMQGKPWRVLDAEIRRWIPAVKAAFRVVFFGERRQTRRVCPDLTPVADLAFHELCDDHALQLLALPRAVAELSKAPERLFRVLDMYEALRYLQPDVEELFCDQHPSSVGSEYSTVCAMLRSAIQSMFEELEDLIRRDPAKEPFPGAGVHPITRYVMNYLSAALGSRQTLAEAIEGAASGPGSPSCTSLAEQVMWIMEILQGNIEAKSKVYRDPSQSCVFLMNNMQYMIRKMRGTELEEITGEDWIRRQIAAVRQLHCVYQRGTWGGLVAMLQFDGTERNSTPSTKALREKLKKFGAAFEETWRTQKEWMVPDDQLRTEMRIATGACVIPAYRSFLARSASAEKSARFSVEEVEARINELFKGR